MNNWGTYLGDTGSCGKLLSHPASLVVALQASVWDKEQRNVKLKVTVVHSTEHLTETTAVLSDSHSYEVWRWDKKSLYKNKSHQLSTTTWGGGELLTAPQTTTLCYSEDLNISRPIVSRINSATCNISKHITNILNPLMESTPHHIKHSTDALQTWAESRWCPSIVMWSHHLYTWSSGDHQITDSSLENRPSCTPSQICYSTASPPHFCNPL